jgi:hypothetical protein
MSIFRIPGNTGFVNLRAAYLAVPYDCFGKYAASFGQSEKGCCFCYFLARLPNGHNVPLGLISGH